MFPMSLHRPRNPAERDALGSIRGFFDTESLQTLIPDPGKAGIITRSVFLRFLGNQWRAKPIVAVTMGDPAGIGPEVVRKTLADPLVKGVCSPLILGDWRGFGASVERQNQSSKLVCWQRGKRCALLEGHYAGVVCSLSLSPRESRPGRPTRAGHSLPVHRRSSQAGSLRRRRCYVHRPGKEHSSRRRP